MSFRRISKCCFYDSFSPCCHCYVFFVCVCACVLFFFLMWHMISSCQWMQTSQSGILKHFSVNISHGSMGLQIAWRAAPPCVASQTGISTLTYLRYRCVCCQLCWCICQKKKTCYLTLYVAVLSDQEHMTTRSERRRHDAVAPRLCPHAAVGERIIVYVSSIPKWLTAHSCVCTLL